MKEILEKVSTLKYEICGNSGISSAKKIIIQVCFNLIYDLLEDNKRAVDYDLDALNTHIENI